MKNQKILFVCRYNCFRSKIAEFFFNKFNKNKNVNVVSGGLIPCERIDEVHEALLKKLGIKLNTKHKGINVHLLKKVDKIIVVADDVPKSIFNHPKWKNKVTIWKIPESRGEYNKAENVTSEIKKRVEKLVLDLK